MHQRETISPLGKLLQFVNLDCASIRANGLICATLKEHEDFIQEPEQPNFDAWVPATFIVGHIKGCKIIADQQLPFHDLRVWEDEVPKSLSELINANDLY